MLDTHDTDTENDDMKTRMATLLSVAGVLAAGSAAALVNTQVLEGGDDGTVSAEAATVTLETNAAGTLGATLAPTAAPDTTPSTSSPPTTERSSRRSSTTSDPTQGQQVFQVGESGLVTVQRDDDTLTVVDATANSGWTVVSASAISPSEIRVVYRSSTVEVTFTAATAFGQIGTDVTARSLVSQPAATAPSSNTTPNSTPTTYDDSDDDGYDDDDHDDDDQDDDDHDDEDDDEDDDDHDDEDEDDD
jgi:hypothetical protein